MKRKTIIDGYNLIFQIPELRRLLERDLEGARDRFLDSLAHYAAKKQADYTVVFDGDGQDRPGAVRRKGVRILFSRPPLKADPVIKRMLSEKKNNEEMVVVTSDMEICNYARICGVKVELSQKFAKDMTAEPAGDMEKKFDHRLSESEVEAWMALFKENGDASAKDF